MKIPYKPSELLRATVKREVRVILGPELDAPPGSYRLVQVFTPDILFLSFDKPSEDTAGGRDYLMAKIPAGVGVIAPFPMLPEQTLYAMAASTPGTDHASLVFASLLVQHWAHVNG